jgi:scyllo-inositol 2-dehydrogenase (NADP+)
MQTTRIVVVGYGRWGRVCHAPLIRMTPGLELVGVVSGDGAKREQIRADLGVQAYENLDQVLADESVDAVVLATPNDTHADYSIRALNAGKHVVTDKPMCLSLAECDAMIEAANRAQKVLTVFQNRRRDGDFLTLQNLIQDGELGDVRWIEMAWQGFKAPGGWRGKAEQGGGRFLDLGAHLIDQMLLFFPQPIESVYFRTAFDFAQSEVESEAFLVLGFEGGATGVCDMSSLAAISKPRFYARGTGGTWLKSGLDPQEAALIAGNIDSAAENPETFGRLKNGDGERIVPTQAGRWRDFYENFAAAVAGEAAPMVKLSEARRLVAVFEAARRSAREGQVVGLE